MLASAALSITAARDVTWLAVCTMITPLPGRSGAGKQSSLQLGIADGHVEDSEVEENNKEDIESSNPDGVGTSDAVEASCVDEVAELIMEKTVRAGLKRRCLYYVISDGITLSLVFGRGSQLSTLEPSSFSSWLSSSPAPSRPFISTSCSCE